MPEADFWQAVRRLSLLQRRRGNLESAVELWEKAAAEGHVYAHVEMAKYFEHQRRDIPAALEWTRKAMEHVGELDIPRYEYKHWMEELKRRETRLEGKSG
jgi:TPR repeat protein